MKVLLTGASSFTGYWFAGALHEAGINVRSPVYSSGVSYLLRNQYADGSWLARSRAYPVQLYAETGFPFGRHQWISAAGTSWASLALV